MPIAPIAPIGASSSQAVAGSKTGGGFGDLITKGIDNVNGLQQAADAALSSFASGGPVQIHEVMAATAKATLGMQVMVEIRNRALEAYQQISNIQV